MSDRAYLRHGDAPATSHALAGTRVLLFAKYGVPSLWPALFQQTDFASLSSTRPWSNTSLECAIDRLRELWSHAQRDAYFNTIWAACAPMLGWLAELAPGGCLILDAREIAPMEHVDNIRGQLASAAAISAKLRVAWDSRRARTLLPPWMNSGDVKHDSAAVTRWFGDTRDRPAFLGAAFGWPSDAAVLESRWNQWFAMGTTIEAPSTAEQAHHMRGLLEKRGLVTFVQGPAQDAWIERFLSVVIRQPTVENLREVLSVMLARRSIIELHATDDELMNVLRAGQWIH